MDWTLLTTSFVTIFLAELGDKTQLATMALAATPGARISVFLGASAALVLTSALGVLAGEVVAKHVSPLWINRLAGGLFVVLGMTMLVKSGN